MIKDGSMSAGEAHTQTSAIQGMIDALAAKSGIVSDKATISQVAVLLLHDSLQSYKLYSSGSQKVDYENAAGLADLAERK